MYPNTSSSPAAAVSHSDRHFQHAIPLVCEQIIGCLDFIKLEAVHGHGVGIRRFLKANSIDNVCFDFFSELGPPAIRFVEKADPARSILGDGAMLIMRNGDHTISLGSSQPAQRDRGAARKPLDELRIAAAKRPKKPHGSGLPYVERQCLSNG